MVDHSNYDRAAREWDAQHIIHPWDDFAAPDPDARSFVTHGAGIHIHTDDGRKLLDGPGGMWCVQIGYDRPEMADAMAEQARRLPYYSPFNASNAVSAELANKLTEFSPGDLNNVCFTTGGSTAVDAALRFVQFRNNVLGQPEKVQCATSCNQMPELEGEKTPIGRFCNESGVDLGFTEFRQVINYSEFRFPSWGVA